MATISCTNSSLNIACFQGQVISRLEKLSYLIWYMSNELKANGGPDYTSAMTIGTNSLLNQAKQQFKNYSLDQMLSAQVSIAYNNAASAGANVTTNPNVTIGSIRRLQQINENDLYRMLTLLTCQLGRHIKPPQ